MLDVQQHAFPHPLYTVKMVRTRKGRCDLAGIVDVHAGLERELLGQQRVLPAMVVAETEVMGTAERQLGLQLATDLFVFRGADLVDKTCHLVALGDVYELVELMLEHLPLGGANLAVHCNRFFL